jgi:hypothetical protein
MKTSILKFVPVIILAMLITVATTATSCKKDQTCKGRVHVQTDTGTAVAGATVKLNAPGGDVEYSGTTDGSGDAVFEVTLPAIFDVTAISGTSTGTGVIRLDEPGKEDDVTITLN